MIGEYWQVLLHSPTTLLDDESIATHSNSYTTVKDQKPRTNLKGTSISSAPLVMLQGFWLTIAWTGAQQPPAAAWIRLINLEPQSMDACWTIESAESR